MKSKARRETGRRPRIAVSPESERVREKKRESSLRERLLDLERGQLPDIFIRRR